MNNTMITMDQSTYNLNRLKCAHNWHTLEKFQDLLHKIDFADLRNLDDILYTKKVLWDMSCGFYDDEHKTAFSALTPFSPGQVYVYVYAPEYVQILTKLKKNMKRLQDLIATNSWKDFVNVSKDMVDMFYDDLADLKKMIYDQIHVYDKAKFEQTFQVRWD